METTRGGDYDSEPPRAVASRSTTTRASTARGRAFSTAPRARSSPRARPRGRAADATRPPRSRAPARSPFNILRSDDARLE